MKSRTKFSSCVSKLHCILSKLQFGADELYMHHFLHTISMPNMEHSHAICQPPRYIDDRLLAAVQPSPASISQVDISLALTTLGSATGQGREHKGEDPVFVGHGGRKIYRFGPSVWESDELHP